MVVMMATFFRLKSDINKRLQKSGNFSPQIIEELLEFIKRVAADLIQERESMKLYCSLHPGALYTTGLLLQEYLQYLMEPLLWETNVETGSANDN